jgi:hypothetical protein
MRGKIILLSAIVLLALTSAWAADVNGKWIAHVPGVQGQGDSDIALMFKVDGEKLTGTLNNSQAPGDVELNEGKVSGDDISFSLMRNGIKILWKGKISGDEIKFTRTVEGGGGLATEIIAKRTK